MSLTRIIKRLSRDVDALAFEPPVTHVYNPLDYAWTAHREYLTRYGEAPKQAVFVGMNPGPFGMAQTGVPFGEIASVRDWLKIETPIGKPENEHPKRPIQGFDCLRSEVSGQRVWSWAADRAGTPENFFRRFFVHNYCPLVFMEETGRNRTPDKLPASEHDPLYDVCDRALRKVVEFLKPNMVIGVGTFAEGRAKSALEGLDIEIGRILHPSPASPAANRGWAEQVDLQLEELGVDVSA